MPTYEYHCDHCGTFEHRQSFSEPTLQQCPKCGGPVRRLISRNVNVIYKTGGYYVSDHRSADYQAKARADGGSK